MVREGSPEITFEQQAEGKEEVTHVGVGGKNVQAEGTGRPKALKQQSHSFI